MKILALDSATSACSVAAWADGAILAAERAEMARGHAEALLPMVDRVRRSAGFAFSDVDRFAVTIGPGHFTGLRAGLAAARGLALASGRPLVGISTLEAVAAGVPADERDGATILVALDSKRAEPYLQAFTAEGRPLAEPSVRPVTDFATEIARVGGRFVIVGDAGDVLLAALLALGVAARRTDALPRPDAAVVARLAAVVAAPRGFPAPLYIHPVETTTPSKAAFSVRS